MAERKSINHLSNSHFSFLLVVTLLFFAADLYAAKPLLISAAESNTRSVCKRQFFPLGSVSIDDGARLRVCLD